MKGTLLLIIAVATMYVAGIYRVPAGLFAAVIELLILVVMRVFLHIMRRRVSCGFTPTQEGVECGNVMPCVFQMDNPGMLPVWYWDARLTWSQGELTERKKLSGQVGSRGKERTQFEVSARHCGYVVLQLKRLDVWDQMRLFRGKIRYKGGKPTLRIPVFPRQQILQVESASGETMLMLGTDQTPLPLVGTDVQEIQQYREYETGDSVKNIHWKLSARGDELWVKEYSRSDERRVGLFLDLVERKPCEPAQMDAFYEIFLALLLGLLGQYDSVYLHWFGWGEKDLITRRVTDEGQYREILMELYDTERISGDKIDEKTYQDEKNARLGEELLQLDLELRLSYGGPGRLLLKQFSLERYRQELEGQKVVIP